MMIEKVTTGISPNALQHLLQLLGDESSQADVNQSVFELLKGECSILRYPQATQQMNYLAAFIKSPVSKYYIQLLLEVDEQVKIVDVQQKITIDEELLRMQLEFTVEENHHFSAAFWQTYLDLPTDPQEQATQNKLQSWALYIEFLLNKMDYPFTIAEVDTLDQGMYLLKLIEEDSIDKLVLSKGIQLFHQHAFQDKPLAEIVKWDGEKRQLLVTSNIDLSQYVETEVRIYSLAEREQLQSTKDDLRNLSNQLTIKPQINNPLLNSYLSQNKTSAFSGYLVHPEESEFAIEQLVNEATTTFSTIAICINNEELEQKLQKQYMHLLPITSNHQIDEPLRYVKSSMLEKSGMKRKELRNSLSKEEEVIQKRSIEQQRQKINRSNEEITKIQDVQNYLVNENKKSDEKINVFKNLILSYQNEQEQLAFRNDQLINAKMDLENAMEEQKQLLEKVEIQQQEDKVYYDELEKNWLIFNKESAIYTDHIVAQKNIKKAEKVIADCQQKIEKIKEQQNESERILKEMIEELQLFKENQQVEQVRIVSKKMKKAAEFLNQPLDLQFAYSYAELTGIYMDKYEEIEELQQRFIQDNQVITQELERFDIQPVNPTTSLFNYDRHYMEEKRNQVLALIDNKPITLGINYKAKQRWKEQLEKAVIDLRSMELAMSNEKELLEGKLMQQLQYAEQLQAHFEEDTNALKVDIQAQQVSFKESHQQYIDIIAAANQEIADMRIEIKKGLQSTKGRSEVYETLSELEKARKGFKAELLAKYEALENQANAIEKVSKYIDVLTEKHQQKEEELMIDKREMNTQMDVLQHDIVNSKTSIENLNKTKYLVDEQYEELKRQIEKYEQKIEIAQNIQAQIQVDLDSKATNEEQVKGLLQEVEKWHEELSSDEVTPEWRIYIEQNSKIHFVHTLQELSAIEADIYIIEDQQYNWLELLFLLNKQPKIAFVTADITERNVVLEAEYKAYLQLGNKAILQRKNLSKVLKENPFGNYTEIYENIDQPYLVVDSESKLSS